MAAQSVLTWLSEQAFLVWIAAASLLWTTAVWGQPATAPASLPSADEILGRYVEVTGGTDAYEGRASEVTRGRVAFTAVGIEGEMVTYSAGGNYRNTVTIPGLGAIDNGVYNGVAWEKTDILGPRIKEGSEEADAVREATINSTLRWRELFEEVAVTGTSEVAGEPCYQVLMRPEQGSRITTCYSIESGLALGSTLRAVTQMGEIDAQVRMLDYRDFNGVLAPSHIQETAAAQTIDITIESIDVNTDIPDSVFAYPDDVAALLALP